MSRNTNRVTEGLPSSSSRPRLSTINGIERSSSSPTAPAPNSRRITGTRTSTNIKETLSTEKRVTRVAEIQSGATTTRTSRPSSATKLEEYDRAARAPSRSGAISAADSHTSSKKDLPWNPEASLRPATTAPLASRISFPPLSTTLPSTKRPPPLDQMSLNLQEASILEDLLFVLMGFEGQYIRFSSDYDPAIEKIRLNGPHFRIAHGLDPSLKDLTNSLLKMATHYCAIEAFIEVQSRLEFGAVNHALCASIRKLLKDYLVLIAQLEHQFLTNPTFTLHTLHLHCIPTSHVLSQLYSLGHEILKKNSLLDDDDDLEDSGDDSEDDILKSLREAADPTNVPGRKVCKGGNVLGLLTQRLNSMSGDPAAKDLLSMLLRESSRPYMTMLNEWLHHGVIKDAHSEFLIKEQKSIRRERLEEDYTDEYWEKRYTIRDNETPPQLDSVKSKVLLAGKYLNVVRECGGVDASTDITDVPETLDDPRFLDNVNAAYAYANGSLLKLLLTTHGLRARLRSLKHYFFLDRSDFFSYFLELSATELLKPAKRVNVSKLQSLLDLALRQPGSIAASDPFKEDIKVQMNDVGLTKWLMRVVSVSGLEAGPLADEQISSTAEDDKEYTGFKAMELDYTVPFPLSLVISRKTVLRYQLLFRYLLSLRHLEILLAGSWQDHSKVASWRNKSKYPQIEIWKRRTFTLRARMLVFVQQLLYFCTSEVLEPNWNDLQQRIEKVTTVDELMQHHVDFLDTCLKECMLTNSRLLKIHAKLTTTCTMFASYTPLLSRALISADSDLEHPLRLSDPENMDATLSSEKQTKLDKLGDNLQRYEENFGRHLKILLDALNYYAATETVVLLGLCARLSTANDGGGGGEFMDGDGEETGV